MLAVRSYGLGKEYRVTMKIKSVNLETVCGITSKMPENDKLEVAFAGRSNVGKSTLINGLMNRKSLARTSSQPGKTLWIFRDTVMRRYPSRLWKSGAK